MDFQIQNYPQLLNEWRRRWDHEGHRGRCNFVTVLTSWYHLRICHNAQYNLSIQNVLPKLFKYCTNAFLPYNFKRQLVQVRHILGRAHTFHPCKSGISWPELDLHSYLLTWSIPPSHLSVDLSFLTGTSMETRSLKGPQMLDRTATAFLAFVPCLAVHKKCLHLPLIADTLAHFVPTKWDTLTAFKQENPPRSLTPLP